MILRFLTIDTHCGAKTMQRICLIQMDAAQI